MSEPELPPDPPGWEARDCEFALARRLCLEKARAWRNAGGYWPVGGNPSHPKEWAEVVAADEAYYAISREVMPPTVHGTSISELRL